MSEGWRLIPGDLERHLNLADLSVDSTLFNNHIHTFNTFQYISSQVMQSQHCMKRTQSSFVIPESHTVRVLVANRINPRHRNCQLLTASGVLTAHAPWCSSFKRTTFDKAPVLIEATSTAASAMATDGKAIDWPTNSKPSLKRIPLNSPPGKPNIESSSSGRITLSTLKE